MSGQSKFIKDVKSIRNVLKMLGDLVEAKMTANNTKKALNLPAEAKMRMDLFFYMHVF